MVYPCDDRIAEFRATLQIAETIVNSSISQIPDSLEEYDSFKAPDLEPRLPNPCREGGKENQSLAGGNIYQDCAEGI